MAEVHCASGGRNWDVTLNYEIDKGWLLLEWVRTKGPSVKFVEDILEIPDVQ